MAPYDLDRVPEPLEAPGNLPRRRLRGKRPPPVPGLPERHVWPCNLCDFQCFRSTRTALSAARGKHMTKCHPDDKHRVNKLRKEAFAVVPVQSLPWAMRSWTCNKCKKALPQMPSHYQRFISINHHMSQCQPKVTKLQNFRKLRSRKGPTEVRQSLRNRRGWHEPEWREQRLAAAKAKGHNVVYIGQPGDEGLMNESVIKLTCTKCKLLQQHSHTFTTNPCQPRDVPRSVGWVNMRVKQDKDMRALLRAWGWGKKQVRAMDAQEERQARRAKRRPAKLPPREKTCWWRDLPEEGVEPNPGPRYRSVRCAGILQTLLTINIGGAGNMWQLLQQLPDLQTQVLFLQETNMRPEEVQAYAVGHRAPRVASVLGGRAA